MRLWLHFTLLFIIRSTPCWDKVQWPGGCIHLASHLFLSPPPHWPTLLYYRWWVGSLALQTPPQWTGPPTGTTLLCLSDVFSIFYFILEHSWFTMFCSRCTTKWVSCTYTYIHFFSRFFSHLGYYRVLSKVSCAISRSLFIYFLYSSVYMLIPKCLIFKSPPNPHFTLVTISLYLKSVSMFPFCK